MLYICQRRPLAHPSTARKPKSRKSNAGHGSLLCRLLLIIACATLGGPNNHPGGSKDHPEALNHHLDGNKNSPGGLKKHLVEDPPWGVEKPPLEIGNKNIYGEGSKNHIAGFKKHMGGPKHHLGITLKHSETKETKHKQLHNR